MTPDEIKKLLSPPTEPVLVTVPEMPFAMVDGSGDPNTSEAFQQAIQALYGFSYTLKFGLKKAGGYPEFKVMPLEALWWSGDVDELDPTDKAGWSWTAMIVQPDFLTPELFATYRDELAAKKGPSSVTGLRYERFEEGLCAEVMHIGPYAAERPTIERLHQFIRASGHSLCGKHHEIYLGDPRRSAPEKLKTVIRQPVK